VVELTEEDLVVSDLVESWLLSSATTTLPATPLGGRTSVQGADNLPWMLILPAWPTGLPMSARVRDRSLGAPGSRDRRRASCSDAYSALFSSRSSFHDRPAVKSYKYVNK
jgi:hypothetical protein